MPGFVHDHGDRAKRRTAYADWITQNTQVHTYAYKSPPHQAITNPIERNPGPERYGVSCGDFERDRRPQARASGSGTVQSLRKTVSGGVRTTCRDRRPLLSAGSEIRKSGGKSSAIDARSSFDSPSFDRCEFSCFTSRFPSLFFQS